MPDEGARLPAGAATIGSRLGDEIDRALEESAAAEPAPSQPKLSRATEAPRKRSLFAGSNVSRVSTVLAGAVLVIAAIVDSAAGDLLKEVKPMELVTAAIAVFTAAGAMTGGKKEKEAEDG